jgi:hypothetical protein
MVSVGQVGDDRLHLVSPVGVDVEVGADPLVGDRGVLQPCGEGATIGHGPVSEPELPLLSCVGRGRHGAIFAERTLAARHGRR